MQRPPQTVILRTRKPSHSVPGLRTDERSGKWV